jgi:hypothetical protein
VVHQQTGSCLDQQEGWVRYKKKLVQKKIQSTIKILKGYILSDAGYDVWLGNARGNRYSKAHKTLSSDQQEFWNFSWQEIGEIDLPTVIDYILKLTIQTKLQYIGHSQVIFN